MFIEKIHLPGLDPYKSNAQSQLEKKKKNEDKELEQKERDLIEKTDVYRLRNRIFYRNGAFGLLTVAFPVTIVVTLPFAIGNTFYTLRQFNNDTLELEKIVETPRHWEVMALKAKEKGLSKDEAYKMVERMRSFNRKVFWSEKAKEVFKDSNNMKAAKIMHPSKTDKEIIQFYKDFKNRKEKEGHE